MLFYCFFKLFNIVNITVHTANEELDAKGRDGKENKKLKRELDDKRKISMEKRMRTMEREAQFWFVLRFCVTFNLVKWN